MAPVSRSRVFAHDTSAITASPSNMSYDFSTPTNLSQRLQFRAARSTRSGPVRGQADNDTLDGLPIRQWRKQEIIVGANDTPSSVTDAPRRGEGIWKELPMPEGSNNYPIWSQQILRAARAGRILQSGEIVRKLYGKKTVEDEGKRVDVEEAEEGEEKRGTKRNSQGFAVQKWTQLMRQQEESSMEYLAKRRVGLPSVHRIPTVNASSLKQIRVRRVDANNQPVIYEVLVGEGKIVQGEATELLPGDDELVVKPAPGTMIEGLGVTNENGLIIYAEAPAALFGRGRAAPPKKKTKRGAAKGRKKAGTAKTTNLASGAGISSEAVAESGDTAMVDVDNSVVDTTAVVGDDDAEDGEEEDDDEGEGDDGEVDADAEGENDDDREEGELTPSPEPGAQDGNAVLQQFKNAAHKPVALPPIPQPQTQPQTQPQQLAASGSTTSLPIETPQPRSQSAAAPSLPQPPLPAPTNADQSTSRESSYSPPGVATPEPTSQPLQPAPILQQPQPSAIPMIPGLSETQPLVSLLGAPIQPVPSSHAQQQDVSVAPTYTNDLGGGNIQDEDDDVEEGEIY
jgi:hypothetical protein